MVSQPSDQGPRTTCWTPSSTEGLRTPGIAYSIPNVPLQVFSRVIRELCGSDSAWVESVPVSESYRGTTWEGNVEIFQISSHRASRCYAWCLMPARQVGRRVVAKLHKG